MHKEVEQFDRISNEYENFVNVDPIRNSLHYPSVIQNLGDITDKRILDIGCGNGFFDRMLAEKYYAKVTGYDQAGDLISLAKSHEEKENLGIEYVVADPRTFHPSSEYDNSVSVMVLPYSPDVEYLKEFFGSAYQALKAEGSFVSISFNPDFKAFGTQVANRLFRKLDGNKVEVNFLGAADSNVKFTAGLSQFSNEDYENAARAAGFNNFIKQDLQPTPESIKALGEQYWKKCIQEQPYSLFIAKK